MQVFAIGALSRLTGVKVPTIRYYEAIGLLASPTRAANGRRVYDRNSVRRLSFIKHARSMDFPIEDIKVLLTLIEAPENSCVSADAIARARLDDVEQRIVHLNTLRNDLKQMISGCSCDSVATCNVIDAISEVHH